MDTDTLGFLGNITIVLTDENGSVKEEMVVPNLVVDSGKNFIIKSLIDTTDPRMGFLALGTGNTAVTPADTTLDNQISIVQTTESAANNVATFSATFGPNTATGALVEMGIFNKNASGDMLCRSVFPVVNKGANDSLTIEWAIEAV